MFILTTKGSCMCVHRNRNVTDLCMFEVNGTKLIYCRQGVVMLSLKSMVSRKWHLLTFFMCF